MKTMASLGVFKFLKNVLSSSSSTRKLKIAPVSLNGTRFLSNVSLPPPALYTKLSEGSKEDFVNAQTHFALVASPDAQTKRLLALLETLKGVNIGNLIDLYEHAIQTASRALRDGADDETVVCALFHDVGEVLTPACHGEVAASLLRPYISAKNDWILSHHEIFQAYYYGDAMNIDKNLRDRFRDHQFFDDCENFCQKWDEVSFDPKYKSFPISDFEPMVTRLLKREVYSTQDLTSQINQTKKDLNVYDFDSWMKSNSQHKL